MKKIFTLALMAVFAMSVTAATGFQDFNKLKRETHLQLKKIQSKMGGGRKAVGSQDKSSNCFQYL